MKYLILLLLSFNAFAEPVTISFQPPTERVDDTPLADSEITRYKWEAYSSTSTYLDNVMANSGNMTEMYLDLPKDKYLICLYAKAGEWSALRCTFVNMFEPKPPAICQ